jgi:hypothetical protein
MGFNPAAISAAGAVVNTPGFRANLDALITNMTLAPAGGATPERPEHPHTFALR